MNKKYHFIIAFVLLTLIQLAVPAKMIWDSEGTLLHGERHLLQLFPIDPNDPFRGKYINLRFEIENYITDQPCIVEGESKQYVTLYKGASRFSSVMNISTVRPKVDSYFNTDLYCYAIDSQNSQYNLELPFKKYFMAESLAEGAERLATESLRDSTSDVYAEVFIHRGQARIKHIYIGEQTIESVISENAYK